MNPVDFRSIINMLESIQVDEAAIDQDQLYAFKVAIASKIKDLPEDDVTIQALKEIEDLLKHVNAGGRMGIINGELKSINDPTVNAAQKDLARFILSIPQTSEQRDELFKLWRSDKLVDFKKLLSVGKNSFDAIITSYNSNPLIKELVNELMHVAALGQGKGEFGLSVMSKSIHKQEGKGDLSISGRPIEVKTTDGGAGRFTDQEVRPSDGFEKAARDLNNFVTTNPLASVELPKSGLSLNTAVTYYEQLSGTKDKKKYLDMVEKVITMIFGGRKNSDVDSIITAIRTGDIGEAMQNYAKASFNYYMSKKKDEGVLYINVATEPISTVYFKEADDLKASSLRLHAGTAYITSISDVRLPYPQIEVIPTTFGANAAAKQEKIIAKQAKIDAKAEELKSKIAGGKSIKIKPPSASKTSTASDSGTGTRERRFK
jgi:hypothetical protein